MKTIWTVTTASNHSNSYIEGDEDANLNYRYSQGKTFALLDSVQKFTEIQGWLLLTFFICLHNQLSSFNSVIVQMSEKRDSS